MAPQPPEPLSDADAQMIARLQGAKGLQPRAWLRENKGVAIALGIYALFVLPIAGVLVFVENVDFGPAIVFGVIFAPLGMLRLWLRWRRD